MIAQNLVPYFLCHPILTARDTFDTRKKRQFKLYPNKKTDLVLSTESKQKL
jgi:hypothetical protein